MLKISVVPNKIHLSNACETYSLPHDYEAPLQVAIYRVKAGEYYTPCTDIPGKLPEVFIPTSGSITLALGEFQYKDRKQVKLLARLDSVAFKNLKTGEIINLPKFVSGYSVDKERPSHRIEPDDHIAYPVIEPNNLKEWMSTLQSRVKSLHYDYANEVAATVYFRVDRSGAIHYVDVDDRAPMVLRKLLSDHIRSLKFPPRAQYEMPEEFPDNIGVKVNFQSGRVELY